MAKITYTSLKLKTKTDVVNVEFEGNQIEVLQYLPVESKYDLLMIALQKAEEDGIYNPFKLDVYFHLNIVYLYTNITFTEKQRENESKLYDALESNGLIDLVLGAIPEDEYTKLCSMLEEIAEKKNLYNSSAVGAIKSMVSDLPANAQAAVDALNGFDVNELRDVVDFVKATNGGNLPRLAQG